MICNPGLLNRKVTIYRPTVVEGDDLDTQQDRVLFQNVSAWISPVRGIQYKENGTDRNDQHRLQSIQITRRRVSQLGGERHQQMLGRFHRLRTGCCR